MIVPSFIIMITMVCVQEGFAKQLISSGLMCQQCGGEKYEGSIRLSRDKCCNASPVLCQAGHVCLRALVYSPYGNFFLSGCHPEEDNLTGCDFHTLPHNSSVRRCVCHDDECQNEFPGDCPIVGITDETTATSKMIKTTTISSQNEKKTKVTTTASRPLLLSDWNKLKSNHSSNGPRGRHHHNHIKTNTMNRRNVDILTQIIAFSIIFWLL